MIYWSLFKILYRLRSVVPAASEGKSVPRPAEDHAVHHLSACVSCREQWRVLIYTGTAGIRRLELHCHDRSHTPSLSEDAMLRSQGTSNSFKRLAV
eukprot:jgi/Tetstr1/465946/TSEL_000909.t1